MDASEFTPGRPITDPQALAAWLRFEEAVYIQDAPGSEWTWCTCADTAMHRARHPYLYETYRENGLIRQALRRVSPETAAAVAADVVTKEGSP